MATGSLVSVGQYLTTSYRPDREYLDGQVVERNVGEYDHARLQTALTAFLYSRRHEWGIHVLVEQRVQVAARRYRVPDICVVAGPEPQEQILTSPPLACIEILSKDDRLADMQDRVDDYLAFGVLYIWLINPRNRKAWRCTSAGMIEVPELRADTPEIVVPVADLFA